MSDRSTKRVRGFSLLEMVVAMALGTLVLGAAVQIYSQGVGATLTVTQRAEMQQDFRAASDILTKDLGLAGAGLSPGAAIVLPSATTPQYGCDQSHCYLNGIAGTYPLQGGVPYLYGLIPGYNKGPVFSAGTTDVTTVAYTDSGFYLNCYSAKVTAKGVVTFLPPVSPATWTTEGCLPNALAAPQAVNDAALGLSIGDIVLMTLGGTTMVAEVTGAVTTGVDAAGNTTYIVPFANSDALKLNQTPTGGGLNSAPLLATGSSAVAPCGATGPCRLFVITYYIDNTASVPRLMRQVSGHTPTPVAENVVYMKFSYDLFNTNTNTVSVNQNDGGASLGLLPNQITKVNILNMAMNGTLKGAQGGYQGADLQTSVSARNLSFVNDYPN